MASPGDGESCENALPLTVPGTVTGTTVAYLGHYDSVSPYTGGVSPDVVYRYTPTADQRVTLFSSCRAPTRKSTSTTASQRTPIACNDDFYPGFQSYLNTWRSRPATLFTSSVDGFTKPPASIHS